MRWHRIALALIAIVTVSASVPLGVSNDVDDAIAQKILRAYKEAPRIAEEIEHYRKAGYEDRGARCLEVSGSCGVAGCSAAFLVVHLCSTDGGNTQTISILARVTGLMPPNNLKVERVELRARSEAPAGNGN
jgi:hypothetical protein